MEQPTQCSSSTATPVKAFAYRNPPPDAMITAPPTHRRCAEARQVVHLLAAQGGLRTVRTAKETVIHHPTTTTNKGSTVGTGPLGSWTLVIRHRCSSASTIIPHPPMATNGYHAHLDDWPWPNMWNTITLTHQNSPAVPNLLVAWNIHH